MPDKHLQLILYFLCVLFLFIAGTVLFFFEYVKQENSYLDEMRRDVENHHESVLLWSETFQSRYKLLLQDYPDYEGMEDARYSAEFWNEYQMMEDLLYNFWRNPERNGEYIRRTEKRRDNLLLELYERNGARK